MARPSYSMSRQTPTITREFLMRSDHEDAVWTRALALVLENSISHLLVDVGGVGARLSSAERAGQVEKDATSDR